MTSRCPRCGERVLIYEYAQRMTDGYNMYDKCMKCKTTFHARFLQDTEAVSPFESEENDDEMSGMRDESDYGNGQP